MSPLTTTTHRAIPRALGVFRLGRTSRLANHDGSPPPMSRAAATTTTLTALSRPQNPRMRLFSELALSRTVAARGFATAASTRAASQQKKQQQHTRPHTAASENPDPHPHPHAGFYHLFGRPVAKVFLMSIICYQGFYWLWLKLEASEEKDILKAELEMWERELERVRPKRAE